MNHEIFREILQLIATVAALGTLMWRWQSKRKAEKKEFEEKLLAIEERNAQKIIETNNKIAEADKIRREETRNIHQRITDMENNSVRRIDSRLSKIEGLVEANKNILNILQSYFVNKGERDD